jgi:hypothetical protein
MFFYTLTRQIFRNQDIVPMGLFATGVGDRNSTDILSLTGLSYSISRWKCEPSGFKVPQGRNLGRNESNQDF